MASINYPTVAVLAGKKYNNLVTDCIESYSKSTGFPISVRPLASHEALFASDQVVFMNCRLHTRYLSDTAINLISGNGRRAIVGLSSDSELNPESPQRREFINGLNEFGTNQHTEGTIYLTTERDIRENISKAMISLVQRRKLMMDIPIGVFGGSTLGLGVVEYLLNFGFNNISLYSEHLAKGKKVNVIKDIKSREGYKPVIWSENLWAPLGIGRLKCCDSLEDFVDSSEAFVFGTASRYRDNWPNELDRSEWLDLFMEDTAPSFTKFLSKIMERRQDSPPFIAVASNPPEVHCQTALLRGYPPGKIIAVSADHKRTRDLLKIEGSHAYGWNLMGTHNNPIFASGLAVDDKRKYLVELEGLADNLKPGLAMIGPRIVNGLKEARKADRNLRYKGTQQEIARLFYDAATYEAIIACAYPQRVQEITDSSEEYHVGYAEEPIINYGMDIGITSPEFSNTFVSERDSKIEELREEHRRQMSLARRKVRHK